MSNRRGFRGILEGDSDPVFYIFGFAHSAIVWISLAIVLTWHTLHAINFFEATQWATSFVLWLPLCSLFLALVASIANYFVLKPHMEKGGSAAMQFRVFLAAATDKYFLTTWVLASLVLSVCGISLFAAPFYGAASHYTNLTALSNITVFNATVGEDEGVLANVVGGGDSAIRRYVVAKGFDLLGMVLSFVVVVSVFNSLPAIALSHSLSVSAGPALVGVESASGSGGEHLASGAASGINSKQLLLGKKATTGAGLV